MTISQSVRSIVNLIQRPGIIRIGFDDLFAALRSPNGRCLFGYGEADSDNRAHDALNQALKSPLMDRGRMLADAEHVLVQVAGGPGMTLSEVEILMNELGKHVGDRTQILFGTGVDGRMGNRLSVTIISSLGGDEEVVPETTPAAKIEAPRAKKPRPQEMAPPPEIEKAAAEPEPEPELETEPEYKSEPEAEVEPDLEPVGEELEALSDVIPFEQPVAEEPPAPPPLPAVVPIDSKPMVEKSEPQPRLIIPKKKPVIAKEARPEKVHAKQEVLQFEPISRGRFEKSEPTIVEGQDLDVPTYLRKNIRVK
jgi:cell division protein FtsZ